MKMPQMNREKYEKIVFCIVALMILVASNPWVASLMQANKDVSQTGVFGSVGLGVYTTSACTTNLTSIAWGTVRPGSNYTRLAFIKNTGNVNHTLGLLPWNWNPAAVSSYVTLTWNYTGAWVLPNQVVPVLLKLATKSSASTSGIRNFSFDVNMTATG